MKTLIIKFIRSNPLQLILICCITLFSCNDKENRNSYDPGKEIELTTFFPDSGGIATKVILNGSNFGDDASKVKVYFNKKQAAVISSIGNMIYTLAPKQPGDDCVISVVIGNDSVSYNKEFKYKTSIAVTTVASKPNSLEDDDYIYDGTLAEVSYGWINSLCIDAENNIFVHQGWPPRIIFLNEEQNVSMSLAVPPSNSYWQPFGQPTMDAERKVIYFPDEGNNWGGPNRDNFYVFDPATQWSMMTRQIIHPTEDEKNAGIKDFNIVTKDALALNPKDGYLWTRVRETGDLIRFHSKTRKGETVDSGLMPGSISKMIFHPTKEGLLYLVYTDRNCIYTYDINTGEHTLFAGKQGIAGWRDGDKLNAEFNKPQQMDFDKDLNIYIADGNNRVIRKITPEGDVSTVIGIPGTAGYQDGNPDDALFQEPTGLAINSEGDIYIGDTGNKCVRKLSIQ